MGPASFRRLCQARDILADDEQEQTPIARIARTVRISKFHFIRAVRSALRCDAASFADTCGNLIQIYQPT
jgi:hypothetical protein